MADFPKEIKEMEYVDENVKVKTKIDIPEKVLIKVEETKLNGNILVFD